MLSERICLSLDQNYPMKKVIYIHGLGSSPVPAKLDIIRSYAEVVALHLDYEQDPDSYKKILQLALDEQVEGVIGSSLGGLIGHHLSENLGLPALLFNPALYRDVPAAYGMQLEQEISPAKMVVQGAKDEIVDPVQVRNILDSKSREDCLMHIIINQDMGHQIDLVNFKRFVTWFFNMIP